MARKQKPVSRLYLVGKSHERQRIATEGESHPPTDNLWRFLHVIDSSNGETPVGNWAPEVRTHEIVPEVLAPDIVRRFAHQRSSHGCAVGSEAATQTDDTSVEPAEALCALTPRARLTTPRDALRPLGASPMRTRRAAERVRDWLTQSTHPPAYLRAVRAARRGPAVVKGPLRPGRLVVARGCEGDTPLPGSPG